MEEKPVFFCRGCLADVQTGNFHPFACDETKNLFTDCTSIPIQPEELDLPQQICTECYTACQQWSDFRDRCLGVNEQLLARVPEQVWLQEDAVKEEVMEDEYSYEEISELPLESQSMGNLIPDEDPIRVDVCQQKRSTTTPGPSPEQKKLKQDEESPLNKRERKRPAQPEKWKKVQRKLLREAGKEYLNTKNELVAKKTLKPVDCSGCSKHCTTFISEEARQDIHVAFWKLDDVLKRHFIINSVVQKPKAKTRTVSDLSRRTMTNCYTIQVENRPIPVCKTFFLNTLTVSGTFVTNALKCKLSGNLACVSNRGRAKKNLHKDLDIEVVKEHINTYERVPNHSSGSQKEYLTAGLSTQQLHNEYIQYCGANGIPPVQIWKYREVFKSLNLAFHKPRNDASATKYEK